MAKGDKTYFLDIKYFKKNLNPKLNCIFDYLTSRSLARDFQTKELAGSTESSPIN